MLLVLCMGIKKKMVPTRPLLLSFMMFSTWYQPRHAASAKKELHRSMRGDASPNCMDTLAASAENGKVSPDNYFVFIDTLSNGYYTSQNMNSYSDLPLEQKFGFVTLSCQCKLQGGNEDCCQGNRARLDVTGIDDPDNMSYELHAFVDDICSVTFDGIGDNILEPTGELPGSIDTVDTVESYWGPTPAPTDKEWHLLDEMDGNPPSSTTDKDVLAPSDGNGEDSEGLSTGAWVGIAIAIAVFAVLVAFLVYKKRTSANNSDATYDKGLGSIVMEEAPPPTPPPTTPPAGTSFDEEHIGEIRATPTSMAMESPVMEDYSTPD